MFFLVGKTMAKLQKGRKPVILRWLWKFASIHGIYFQRKNWKSTRNVNVPCKAWVKSRMFNLRMSHRCMIVFRLCTAIFNLWKTGKAKGSAQEGKRQTIHASTEEFKDALREIFSGCMVVIRGKKELFLNLLTPFVLFHSKCFNWNFFVSTMQYAAQFFVMKSLLKLMLYFVGYFFLAGKIDNWEERDLTLS